jgi:phage minor structural protein
MPDGVTLKSWLGDATFCEVTEERNGIFELYMEVPTASEQYPLIENDCWIKAKPSENGNDQLFRVYSVEKSMAGRAIVQAEHISYLLAAYPVDTVTVGSATATAAMSAVLTRAAALLPANHGFIAVSDVVTAVNFSISAVTARAALGGVQGSVLQRYGGEYEFDGKIVRLHKQRGVDHGVKIEYAKNLWALKASVSTEASYTGLFPFVKSEDFLLTLPEKVLWVTNNTGIQQRVMVKDFSQDLGQGPTEQQLRAAAQSYLAANDINAPDISMEVDFVHLWQSPEYAEFIDLERVALCDIVTVRHPDLCVDVSAKVIKTVYDVIKERYKKITVGSAKSNMASVIAGVRADIEAMEAPDISGLQLLINQAIEDATNAITGNSGGKVILNPALHPQELLILADANQSIQTAVRLWRWNAGGLGFSSNGYNGPFSTAITANGQIVADFITTGTLTANVIKAGVLSDIAGKFSVNMTTGAASLSGATITGGSITITSGSYSTVIDSYGLTTSYATITGGSISIGGSAFRTVIDAGELRQYALGNGTFICGLTPFSAGSEYRPTRYVGDDSRVTGFSISHLQGGGVVNIAQFDKTKIDLIKPVNVAGTLAVSGVSTFNNLITSGTNTHLTLRGAQYISFQISSTERGYFHSGGLQVTNTLAAAAVTATGAISGNSAAINAGITCNDLTAYNRISSGSSSHLTLRGTSYVSFETGTTERGYVHSGGLTVHNTISCASLSVTNGIPLPANPSFTTVNASTDANAYKINGYAMLDMGYNAQRYSVRMNYGLRTTYASTVYAADYVQFYIGNTERAYVSSSGIANSSMAEEKNGIKTAGSALAIVENARLYQYRYTVPPVQPLAAARQAEEAAAPIAQAEIENREATSSAYADTTEGSLAGGPERMGFVIGEGYDPPPACVLAEDGRGVNLYAMSSVCWRGLQELLAEVNVIKKKIGA